VFRISKSDFRLHRVRELLLTQLTLLALLTSKTLSDTEHRRVVFGPGMQSSDLDISSKMDARGKNIRGTQFYGQPLEEANFDGCDLRGVLFHQCELTNASFRNASLTGARMTQCKIDGADFTNAVVNSFDGVLLARQLLTTWSYKSRQLADCTIRIEEGTSIAFDFSNSKLTGALLLSSDYSACNFNGARVANSKLLGNYNFSQIEDTVDYKRGRLYGIAFSKVNGSPVFKNMRLDGCDFLIVPTDRGAFTGATITGCRFSSRFTVQQLTSTKSYQCGDLTGLRLSKVALQGVSFQNVNLTDARFDKCDLTDAKFDDAVITRADFGSCSGLTLGQLKQTWNYANDRTSGIRLPPGLSD